MSEKRFRVVCTGRGKHGRIDWPELVLADDGTIRETATRAEPLAAGRSRRTAIVPAEGHRAANGTWRWRCPRCGIDKPLTEDKLRAWMLISPGDMLDVSQLPRG